jgi:hypothetical protein
MFVLKLVASPTGIIIVKLVGSLTINGKTWQGSIKGIS